MKQFEKFTIKQLKKITEDYERLEIENTKLKIKYPDKLVDPVQDLLDELN